MSYLEIRGKDCVVTLEPRPLYCDRGRWLAKVFPVLGSELARDLDGQDDWPRYYLYLECATREVEGWLRRRDQWLPEADWCERA